MPSRCPCTCPLVARELISPLQTIDLAFAFMREKNTGLTPDGKTFGEVIDHFLRVATRRASWCADAVLLCPCVPPHSSHPPHRLLHIAAMIWMSREP